MRGATTERFVVVSLRLLAASFALVGFLFIAFPGGVLDVLDDLGGAIGDFAPAPGTGARLWLSLGFAYMVAITGICLVAQRDPLRYRPLLLVLAAGKAASSLTCLYFFCFDADVFAYLLNFLVDGGLTLAALWLWLLCGRIDADPAARLERAAPLRPAQLRTLSAICEAMAPPLDGLPGAESEVPVSAAVADFMRALSPRVLRRVRLALVAFEWLPFPWRFSRLDLARREDFLAKLEGSRFGLHGALLLLAKTFGTLGYAVDARVEERLGLRTACELGDGSLPPARPPLGSVEPVGGGEDCDVVIVGSGGGGAVAAALLAEAGLEVVVLEAGGSYDRDSYPADKLEAIAELYRDGGLTIAEGRPPIPVPVARTVGGTTVINSGTCFRTPADRLSSWRHEFGIPWSDADRLDAAFGEAEEFLDIRPVDPARMGRNGQLAMEGAAALGVGGGPIPRNAGSCTQCSSCPYGCPIDAKRGMHVSYLPRAVAAGARIRAGVSALRIDVERGRAAGVRCLARRDGEERPYRVRARRATIVAGGAFGTPELLLRSGLGGGQVGRNLRIHPACWVGARYEEEVRGWEGVMQSYYVDEWEDRGIILEATFTPLPFGGAWLDGTGRSHQRAILEYGHLGSIGVQLEDQTAGRVRTAADGSLKASYRLSQADADRVAFGIARAAEVHFAAGATEVYPNIARFPVLRPGDLAGFESGRLKPSELRLEGFHPLGTARISDDPRRGVCDVDGAVRGVDGLYVADASLIPTAIGVNPLMTIIAFSKTVAAGIAEGAL